MAPDFVLAIRHAALGAPRSACPALHLLSQVSGQCADFRVTKGRQASATGANMGESMSSDVQSHEEVAKRVAGEERRASVRHAARSLGSVTARIIGGSEVDLVNFSNRGVLFECDSRLLIGARTSVRITTPDDNLIISGRVVRSRVKGLVNGALRYDAALVLDAELGLEPKFLDVPVASDAGSDADVLDALESEPSAVEAYLAESEASLLEVAHGADLPLHAADSTDPVVDAEFDVVPEPPPLPEHASPAIEASELEASAAGCEPIAFESDAEIAFEPAVEFAFDEAGERSFDDAAFGFVDGGAAAVPTGAVAHAATGEPAGRSMFDATYMPPAVDDAVVAVSQFNVTPPRVLAPTPASFFDARPSERYGEPPAEAAAAFGAGDGVMFAEAFEGPPPIGDAVTTGGFGAEPAVLARADLPTDDDSHAAVSDAEDRVLLQFAATVPHDLAELRRIAADNQW
jgi:hypothetical protein